MGIQRIGVPSDQAAKQAVENDDNYIFKLSGSRRGPKLAERQRGIWSFLVSPFIFSSVIALQSVMAKGNSGPGEDQAEGANNPAKRSEANLATSDNQGVATPHATDESAADQTGSSGYPAARTQSADAAASEDFKKSEASRYSDSAPNITMPGGGGGGGGGGDNENLDDSSNRADHQNGPSALASSAITVLDQPHTTTPLPIVIDASASAIYVSIATGEEPVLASILPAIDVSAALDGTLLSLKDVVGFDLHLSNDGSFVEVGPGDTVDLHLSVPQAVHAIFGPATELPIVNLSAPNILDELFGSTHGTSTAHLTSETPGILATLDQLVDKDVGATTKLSLQGGMIDAGFSHAEPSNFSITAALPHPHTATNTLDDLLGHSGIISTGNPIDFPATAPVTGDALFSGNHYTDYHVALQTSGPSSSNSSGSLSLSSPVETVVAQLPEALSASHQTANSQADTPAAALQSDPIANHLIHSLDDLSVRNGAH